MATARPCEATGLEAVQRGFAARIRDPEGHPLPDGVDARRMGVYEELFFNTVEGLLAGTFPVLRSLHVENEWRSLVRDFMREHAAATPLYTEVGVELIAWLQAHPDRDDRRPFLRELAHYEWLELALSNSDATPDPARFDPNGDVWKGRPLLSPLAWHLTYRYPVHRIGPDHQPRRPGQHPAFLLVYRDRGDDVRFVELEPATHRLLELLRAQPEWTGRDAVEQVALELGTPGALEVLADGRSRLEDLRERAVILGTRR